MVYIKQYNYIFRLHGEHVTIILLHGEHMGTTILNVKINSLQLTHKSESQIYY